MQEIIMRAEKLCKSVGKNKEEQRILDQIDLAIYKEDFTIIMGASGAGNSTLLYALSGMDSITSGRVYYKEEEISRYKERKMSRLRREAFGFVFQQSNLVSNLTLFENVAVAGYVGKKRSAKAVKERTQQLLEQMQVDQAKDRLPIQVSGGENQRAAIARGVIHEPSILFADEPTGALNKKHSEEALDLLSGLHARGQSILMVTHDLRAAIRGTRLLYLEDGKIIDEIKLPIYTEKETRKREEVVNKWLTALSW